jgi:D-inositol-3-phosphate glycosyltransferase
MMEKKPKLLWISDACVPTGFARVTHNILGWLGSRWERVVIGVNATGDPHPYPYPVFPARVGGDLWGFNRFIKLAPTLKPDVVVIQSDAWIVQGFVEVVEQMKKKMPPLVGFMPVDAAGMKRSTVAKISKLERSIFYTRWGEKQAQAAGLTGKSAAIGLGVRREIYKPQDKLEARRMILPDVPPDAFVIGNVNRNQPRKRLDLTIKYFAEFLKRGGDAYLYLHSLREDVGFDLIELSHWYGIADRVFMPKAKGFEDLQNEALMPAVYSMLDLQISTTLGEGWGLPTLEGMACGTPQLVPDWAALAEWARGGVRFVAAEPGDASFGQKAFGIGAVAKSEDFVAALLELRQNPDKLKVLAESGKALAAEPEFQWEHVARRIDHELAAVVAERRGIGNVSKREPNRSTIQRRERCAPNASMRSHG